MKATVRLQREPFDAAAEAAILTRDRSDIVAAVTFMGICRGVEDVQPIAALTLEHYPGMAEAEIERHVTEAGERWPLQGVTRAHRTWRRHSPGCDDVVSSTGGVCGSRIPHGLSENARSVLEAIREGWQQDMGRCQGNG